MPKNPKPHIIHDGDAEVVGQIQAAAFAVRNAVLDVINDKLSVDGEEIITEGRRNAPNGVAGLGSDGKVPKTQIPAIGITGVQVVADIPALLALNVSEGIVVVVTGVNKTFIRNNGTSGTISDWTELVTNAVQSVAGKVGNVTLEAADISDLQTALAGKANTAHTHTLSSITDAGSAAALSAPSSGNASSTQVVKGSDTRLTDARTPTAHTHPVSDVNGLQSALDTANAPKGVADITGLQTALDGKAATSHTHAIGDVTGLQTSIDGTTSSISSLTSQIATKADASHTHPISDVTNLQTSLDGKAASSHTHAISDVTSLQTSLNSKAAASHTHAIADVVNLQSTLDSLSGGGVSLPINISDVTNLQTSLDGKASSTHQHMNGSSSLGLGTNALLNMTPNVSGNVAVGPNAARSLTSGYNNVALGSSAQYNATTGYNNVSVGSSSLNGNVSGVNNIAIGSFAGSAGNASNRVAIGYTALQNTNDDAGANTGIGSYALRDVTSGSINTALGYYAGDGLTTGRRNVFIGGNTNTTAGSVEDSVAIGWGAQVTASNQAVLGGSAVTETKLRGHVNISDGVSGALTLPITTVTSSGITLNATHHTIVCLGNGASNISVGLPAATTCRGRVYNIKRTTTGSTTVIANGTETIDGAATYALAAQWDKVTVQSDGTNWVII